MVTLNTATLPLTIVFTLIFLVIPVIYLIVLACKKKSYRKPLLIGITSFILSQIVLRIPLLSMLSGNAAFSQFCQTAAGVILVGGLSAGLFEETTRFVFAKTIFKKDNSFENSLVFGLGHGLWEVVAIIGMTYMNNVILIITLLSVPDPITALGLDISTYEALISQLNLLSLTNMTLALFERICTVLFHMAMSVLVFEGARTKKFYLFPLAILLHTAMNSSIVFGDMVIIEIIIGVFGAGSLVYILKKRKQNAKKTQELKIAES